MKKLNKIEWMTEQILFDFQKRQKQNIDNIKSLRKDLDEQKNINKGFTKEQIEEMTATDRFKTMMKRMIINN